MKASILREQKEKLGPQVLNKETDQRTVKDMTTDGIENYIQNKNYIQNIYGISISGSTVVQITDKILPIAKQWQQPLESIYAVVFLDAIRCHVYSEGQIVKKKLYKCHRGQSGWQEGRPGLWVGEYESAKLWTTTLNGVKTGYGRPTPII